jgi:DNA-directed RNA polymerase sigma subunit (sigma70/sigma32)
MRGVFIPSDAPSFGEIGRELGVSKSRVQQIEVAALKKMKKLLAEKGYTAENLLR